MFESLSSFESDGLSYRLLTEDDKTLFVSLYTSHEVMRFIRTPYSQQEAELVFKKSINNQHFERKQQFIWFVRNAHCGFGFVGLTHLSDAWDLGAVMVPESLGRGWGTKVMSTLLSRVFEQFPISKVTGRISVNNKSAVKSVKKIGFEYMGEDGDKTQMWVIKRENLRNEY